MPKATAEPDYRDPATAIAVVAKARKSVNKRTGVRWTETEMAAEVGVSAGAFSKWAKVVQLAAATGRGVRRLDRRISR